MEVNNKLIKFTLILVVIEACLLLIALYTLICQGKLIAKTDERRALAFFWAIILILWVFFVLDDMDGYMHHKDIYNINDILNHITWVEISILAIIVNMKLGEIRERGICRGYFFYRWDKIRDYYWLTSSIIQFKVNVFLNINWNFKLTVAGDKDEAKIDELLKKYIKASGGSGQ